MRFFPACLADKPQHFLLFFILQEKFLGSPKMPSASFPSPASGRSSASHTPCFATGRTPYSFPYTPFLFSVPKKPCAPFTTFPFSAPHRPIVCVNVFTCVWTCGEQNVFVRV